MMLSFLHVVLFRPVPVTAFFTLLATAFVSYLYSHLCTFLHRAPPRQECSSWRPIRLLPLPNLLLPTQAEEKINQVLYMLNCVPYLLIYKDVNVWWIYAGSIELKINITEGPKSPSLKKLSWWNPSTPNYFVLYHSFLATFQLSL